MLSRRAQRQLLKESHRTGTFDTDALNALRASSDVEYIEDDGIFQLEATVTQSVHYVLVLTVLSI